MVAQSRRLFFVEQKQISLMLPVERGQELIGDRSPPVRIKPQQMAVVGDAVQQLEARVAAGGYERLVIFADEIFLVEAVAIGIEPELRDLGGRRISASTANPLSRSQCASVENDQDLS